MMNRSLCGGYAWAAGLGLLMLAPWQNAWAQQRFVSGASSRTSTTGTRPLGQAHFEVDPQTRSLIATTDDETGEHIKKVIEELDKPVPQALIKVLFLEVTHGDDLDLGTDIKYTDIDSKGRTSSVASLFGSSAATDGAIAKILDNDLQVTLRALSTVTKLEVLSRPSVMARNNQPATITVGQEVPFIRDSRTTDTGDTINTVQYEDIGIILTVTPHINASGLIEMDLAPQISTLTGDTVPISSNVNAPVFAKRSADTHVVVPSGKTVVIGGMMQDQTTQQVRKVPFLGDIWGLGAVFRRTTTSKTKTELLIFVTPTLVDANRNMAAVSNDEMDRAVMGRKLVSPEQVRKYFPDAAPKTEK